MQGSLCRVEGSGFHHDREAVVGARRLKYWVQGLGLRVQGLGSRVQCFGFSTMIGKPSSARDGSRRVPACRNSALPARNLVWCLGVRD